MGKLWGKSKRRLAIFNLSLKSQRKRSLKEDHGRMKKRKRTKRTTKLPRSIKMSQKLTFQLYLVQQTSVREGKVSGKEDLKRRKLLKDKLQSVEVEKEILFDLSC